ncbi:MAG TPA: biotin--[acetyl-CoA-carboxylase] ligase [Candidatus Baltobacteraceae bacterium]|jgi:BirA family biotin operon repressor/biotin-[acetyl-CoA-carboxylase] ligase|nr:biotin--[acetyl-CoA-carboxylase] ligase [Candidatus Baltobacteraceae bacterium]
MLDISTVRNALRASSFTTITHTTQTESTNDDASAMMADGSESGIVLVTEYQRAGRGRRDRRWIAPAGSALLCTSILPGSIAAADLWAVPFWCALVVADAIDSAASLHVDLQWPNDLLIAGRKCCGILCISRINGEDARVACGVGLNVLRPDDEELAELVPPPAFLSDYRRAVSREEILIELVRAYERRHPELRDVQAVARAWERRAAIAGTPYRILIDGASETIDALAQGLAPDGSLIIEANEGTRRVSIADARVIR